MDIRKQPSRKTFSGAPWLNASAIDLTSLSDSSDSLYEDEPYTPAYVKPASSPTLKLVKTKQQQQQPKGPKQAPFRSIRNVDAIYTHFSERVKDQPALYNISATISAIVNRSFLDNPDYKKVDKLLFAGVSGCGKTELVLTIKHFLGMDNGYEYENKFVFLDGSTLTNETQVNAVTGAAPGLVGYRDGNSLADRLNKAIGLPVSTKTPSKPVVSKKTTALDTPIVPIPPVITPPPPRFLMLVIDELDKVSGEFLEAINGLIETGDYETPDGISFKKPAETSMVIVFTCNYGEKELVAMKVRDDEVAETHILADMRQCGVLSCTIGRLGDIFPFYPLSPVALQQLLATRLEEHIQRTPLANQFGKNKRILCRDEVKAILVTHVLGKLNSDLGVRGAMKQLLRKIDLLFEKAFSVLTEMVNTGTILSEDDELEVSGHRFNIREFDETVLEHELSTIIRSIKANPSNAQTLEICRSKRDETLNLDAMGVKIGNTELCHFIIPVATIIINNNHYHEHHHHHHDTHEAELRQLKQTIAEVTELVRHVTQTNRATVIEHIKKLTGISSQIITLDDSDDDEDAEVNKKRKREEIEVDVPIITVKRVKSSFNAQAGRQPRRIDGFTPTEYMPNAKRYLYRCNDCQESVDSRKVGVHQCK